MNKNLHDINRLFIQSLENYNEEPPENIWQAIENDLNRKDAETYRRKYKSLQKTIICWILICASLLAGDILQLSKNNSVRYKPDRISSFNKNNLKKINPNNAPTNSLFENKSLKENFMDTSRRINARTEQSYSDNKLFYGLLNSCDITKDLSIASSRSKVNSMDSVSSPTLLSPNSLKESLTLNEIQDESPFKTKKNEVKQKHPFYIIPFFSLDHIINRLQVQYEYDDQGESDFTQREKPDMSYTMGLLLEYGLSKKLSMQSGFLLSNSFTSISSTVVRALQDNSGLYKFKLATTYGLAEIKNAGVPQIGDSILLKGASLHLQYISVPLLVKVNLKPGKLNINGTAGVGINRIIGDKAEIEYATTTISEYETVEKIEGLKNTFFIFVAGAEATYSVNKRISIGINPLIRYAITPINKGTPMKTYPVSMGIGAAMHIKL